MFVIVGLHVYVRYDSGKIRPLDYHTLAKGLIGGLEWIFAMVVSRSNSSDQD